MSIKIAVIPSLRIKTLNMACNDLFELPADINKMTSLETLDLHDNLLESLPDTICKMVALTKIDISDNKIKQFPNKMPDLEKKCEVSSEVGSVK